MFFLGSHLWVRGSHVRTLSCAPAIDPHPKGTCSVFQIEILPVGRLTAHIRKVFTA